MNTASRAVKCLDPPRDNKDIPPLSVPWSCQTSPDSSFQAHTGYNHLWHATPPFDNLILLNPPHLLTTLNFYVLENFPRFNLNISCIIVYPRERVFTRLDPRILSKVGFKRFTAPGTVSAGLGLYLGETLSWLRTVRHLWRKETLFVAEIEKP